MIIFEKHAHRHAHRHAQQNAQNGFKTARTKAYILRGTFFHKPNGKS